MKFEEFLKSEAVLTAQNWIQATRIGGDRVTWGSDEILYPHLTVKDIEELSQIIAAKMYLLVE